MNDHIIYIFAVVGFFQLVLIFILLYQGLIERKRNHQMTEMVRRLMHYRDIVILNGDANFTDENGNFDADQKLFKLFKEVDKRIMKEHLFTDPNFGRDDLVRLFGTDKNNLPSVIQRFANTNVPGYINIKRMEYAIQLIKQHPEYTLGAIAEACGIKSAATFIRNFRNTYGMTPSEFRRYYEKDSNTPEKINI